MQQEKSEKETKFEAKKKVTNFSPSFSHTCFAFSRIVARSRSISSWLSFCWFSCLISLALAVSEKVTYNSNQI